MVAQVTQQPAPPVVEPVAQATASPVVEQVAQATASPAVEQVTQATASPVVEQVAQATDVETNPQPANSEVTSGPGRGNAGGTRARGPPDHSGVGELGDGLSVDLAALDQARREVRRAAGEILEVRVADIFGDVPAALPATDTSAACVDLGRRVGAGVLAYARALEVTADLVAAAAQGYRATDARLASAVTGRAR